MTNIVYKIDYEIAVVIKENEQTRFESVGVSYRKKTTLTFPPPIGTNVIVFLENIGEHNAVHADMIFSVCAYEHTIENFSGEDREGDFEVRIVPWDMPKEGYFFIPIEEMGTQAKFIGLLESCGWESC